MPVLEQADRPPLPAPESASRRGAHELQVFVDDSGRRARRVRLAGLAVVTTCACWLGALTVGIAGFAGFAPGTTTGYAPTTLHHVLAGRPTDRDRTPLSGSRAHPRTRPLRLARAADALDRSRV
jgi:hypothetical protein